jgi:glycine/D-amino acid oxidase-like deaminating enzyme
MAKVVVVGCGVIGAAIAYELSQNTDFTVTVVDRQQPAQASTGAALGVLMGVISQKLKGQNLRLRLDSIQRYNQWVPALEAATGKPIPFNQQGILRLCFAGENLHNWQTLIERRRQQGWQLDWCDRADLLEAYPHLNLERVVGAIYSPQDRQLNPTALTLALVKAAQQREVTFQFDTAVLDGEITPTGTDRLCRTLHTTRGSLELDWLVIAAGTGSMPLTARLQQSVDIRPVLGQALRVKLEQPLGNPAWQPVITGEDTHLVPLGAGEYWIGATVEFPPDEIPPPPWELQPNAAALEQVWQRAISLWPALAEGEIVQTWHGLRPRPEGRPAPIIEWLPGYDNVLLATGHYRNGILLAPATAAQIRQLLEGKQSSTSQGST